jgi:NAD+ diphosphatase
VLTPSTVLAAAAGVPPIRVGPVAALLGTGGYDRVAERRLDEDWLATAWTAPGTRILTIAGTRIHAPDGLPAWSTAGEVPDGVRVLLGSEADRTTFAVIAPPEHATDDGWVGLRALIAQVPAEDAAYLLHAIGLAEWHWAVRFCPRCGGALEPRSAGHVLHCPACGREQFPRTDPAVIMLVTDDQDRALLGRQRSWPPGRWSTLAGFVEPGESAEGAVRREVHEETGVRVGEVRYVASQPWPLPASLMLGFTAEAVGTDITVDGEEIEQARWWSRADALAAAESGELVIPPGVSISRSLIIGWYGDDLPGSWT